MALRKIYLAVECYDDIERDKVQELANEISNTRSLKAPSLLNMAPLYYSNREELTKLFSIISTKGVKGLLSIEGGLLLKKLASKH